MKTSIKSLLVGAVVTFGLFGMPTFAEEPTTTPKTTQMESTRISINSADAPTLAKHLVGIGPAKAEAIIAWRNAHGRFTSVEQLLEVKGIGEATLNKNKTRVTL